MADKCGFGNQRNNIKLRQSENKIQQTQSDVDISLIKKYLRLSPTERILANHSAAQLALELKKYAPKLKRNNQSAISTSS